MRKMYGPLLLCLPFGALLAASCGSDPEGHGTPANAGGNGDGAGGGEMAAHAGEPGAAAASHGAASATGGAPTLPEAGSGGAPLTNAGSGSGGEAGLPIGGSGEAGAAGGGGAPPLVAEVSCVAHQDCYAVCQAHGWPSGHCYGSGDDRYCACDSSGESPTCVKGTTEGCPAGTACRTTHQCMPYGDATQGDPCNNGDECAPNFICTGFGNPLPNGESTACLQFCDARTAPLSCDCVGGSCMGGLGLYDFTCSYPAGTPCNQTAYAGQVRSGHITGPNELTAGYVYIVTAESLDGEDIDLQACADEACAGDHGCTSSSGGDSETCILQASQDTLDVYVLNRAADTATVKVDVEADIMAELELEHTQVSSSLIADGHMRLLVTGLTPTMSYEFVVTTTNGLDINLTVSNDLHGEDELCSQDATAGTASCALAVSQGSVWAVLTDTSGIGDAYTFKVTAE